MQEREYTVTVSYSGLPVVIIDTPDKKTIPSKHEDWLEKTTITILNPDGSEDLVSYDTETRSYQVLSRVAQAGKGRYAYLIK